MEYREPRGLVTARGDDEGDVCLGVTIAITMPAYRQDDAQPTVWRVLLCCSK